MASGRKRKYGSIVEPSEDELNDSIMAYNESILSGSSAVVCSDDDLDGLDDNETEVFNDPVHGHFELPVLLLKIIDTPQFQRLRNIRQMGGSFYLSMGAYHTRFEHSLGVAYLAGKLCKVLQKRQPELNITKKDVLCLQIAGLCHDIGHGPFSHAFDKLFLSAVKPDENCSHEKRSIEMFDHMLKENDLEFILLDNGLDTNDIVFIKELIGDHDVVNLSITVPTTDGERIVEGCEREKQKNICNWLYKGRSKDKSFLYEIVSNKTSGVDVDKWDYLARDSFHTGIANSFNYKRYLKFARVIMCDGRLQICTRDKEIGTVYEMFHMRNVLHRRTCMHKTKVTAELMLCEALAKANDYIQIPGKDGKMCTMADCIHDMYAFTKLNDHVISLIETSLDERLKEAQEILHRLHVRDFYKLVAQKILPGNSQKGEIQVRNEIYNKMEHINAIEEDFIVKITKFNYGKKDDNPVEHVRFYEKGSPNTGVQIKQEQISHMLPKVFSEHHIRLFSKRNDPFLINHASVAFHQWFDSSISIPTTKS